MSGAHYRFSAFFLALSLGFVVVGQEPDSVERDYSSELPRFEPLSPEEAIKSFKLAPGFSIELVAAEPLVTDPIAFAFDSRNRLFVVEMRGYSEQPDEQLGKIALLEDRDEDGRMDTRHEFVTGLSWPTGIWPWKDGVLVLEPPTITWYRDLDDDGVSDTSELWFDGFGRSNVQGMANSLRWGLDCHIYGSSSSVGASVNQYQAASETDTMTLRRRDFRIDPLTKMLSPSSGGAQHGMSFNRWGDKFLTSNSDHLQQVLDLDQWLAKHALGLGFLPLRKSIAADGPQAEVYRSSPVEPWRVVRTRLRVGGIVPGPVEGGGRAAGYFTGATGTMIADAEAGYSANPSFDTALVCDVGSNLVHRKHLLDEGLYWKGVRIDEQAELVASTDTWFRPVQLGPGPDGCVYIADMYREVIEHPKSLHPVIKKHLDLTSGRDRGRIWRLVSNSSKLEKPSGNLHDLGLEGLVEMLLEPNRWQRDMAAQMLLERSTTDAGVQRVGELLKGVSHSKRIDFLAESHIQVTYLAARLGQLSFDDLRPLLAHSNDRVVEHALKIARQMNWSKLLDESLQLSKLESDLRVQLEIVLNSVSMDNEERLTRLSDLMPHTQDAYVRSAFVIAAGKELWQLVDRNEANLRKEMTLKEWILRGTRPWLKQMDSDSAIQGWLSGKVTDAQAMNRKIYLEALGHERALVDRVVRELTGQARETLARWVIAELANPQPSPELLPWIICTDEDSRLAIVEAGIQSQQELRYQQAVVDWAIANGANSTVLVVEGFSQLSPSVQRSAVQSLATSIQGQKTLIAAVQAEQIAVSQLSAEVRSRLRQSDDEVISSSAQKLFGVLSADRDKVVATYVNALPEDWGPVSREGGKQHFAKLCAQCHRLDSIGTQVGAGLRDLQQKSPQQLITAILDPNREVDPRYASVTVLLKNDQVLTGIVSDETSAEIELSVAGGERKRILRSDVEQLQSRGRSLMPEGLEQQISAEQMVELLKFLRDSE